MLAITAKVKLLKKEVAEAKTLCQDIYTRLVSSTDQLDYRKELGIFAVQAPDWKILTDEKNKIIHIVRQVCTGELSPVDAAVSFDVMRVEFEELYAWLQIPKSL